MQLSPRERRQPPSKPAILKIAQEASKDGTLKLTTHEIETMNVQAFDNYMEQGRVSCPNCSRGFLQGRLEVHLRSCQPGGFFARQRTAASRMGSRGSGGFSESGESIGIFKITSASSGKMASQKSGSVKDMFADLKVSPKASADRLTKLSKVPGLPMKPSTPMKPQSAAAKERPNTTSTVSYPPSSDFAMKFCTECGVKYGDSAKFCPFDGSKRT